MKTPKTAPTALTVPTASTTRPTLTVLMTILFALTFFVIFLAPNQVSAQMISPQQGETYTTPTIIEVSLTNGCLLNNVRLYKYRTDAQGVEQREYFSQVVLGNLTNVYQLNPYGPSFHCSCGDYDVVATYTLNGGATYQQVASGRITIFTDTASITIREPTYRTVAVRGTYMTVCWDIIAKPGKEGVAVGLITPDGASMANIAGLQISGDAPVFTNQFTWQVFTNTSLNAGGVPLPDGTYELQIVPLETGGSGLVPFIITAEPTTAPTTSIENLGHESKVSVASGQTVGRFWQIESSRDMKVWTATDQIVYEGGSAFFTNSPSYQFFRAREYQ